jgi:hypothetical protein
MRVRLSGGSGKERNWGHDINTKAEAAAVLRKSCKNVQIVTSGEVDYLLIPDSVHAPSDTAVARSKGAKITTFSRFLKSQKCKQKSTSKHSVKKKSRASKSSVSKKSASRKKPQKKSSVRRR